MNGWKKKQHYNRGNVDFSMLEGILGQIAMDLAEPDMVYRNKKVLLGFSMVFDQHGRPRVESFGTIKPLPARPENTSAARPLIEINELSGQIDITVEMKNINPENLKYQVIEKKIIFSIPGDKPFYKLVRLNSNIQTQPAKKFYNNGILELTFMKTQE